MFFETYNSKCFIVLGRAKAHHRCLNTLKNVTLESAKVGNYRQEVFCEKVFLKISQNLLENTSARVSFFT